MRDSSIAHQPDSNSLAADSPIELAPIEIVYEESHFLLVNKPAGLFCQAAAEIDSLEKKLALQLKVRDCHPGDPFVGLPHRLDRGTSGILLIARNQRALKRFGEQFQSRKVRKWYWVVVEGAAREGEQRWEDFVRKIPDRPQAEIVGADAAGAKLALATARCLHRQDGLSLLWVQIETGRMHQIRIQAASRGLPVLGDAAYGAKLPFLNPFLATTSHDHPPVALHAFSIEFRHPQSAKVMRFNAPVARHWQTLPPELVQVCSADPLH